MKELSGIPNPFRNAIVSDPWRTATTDVPEIHAKVFLTCCSELETVRSQEHSSSVLIHGEPGSGKTHLLSRLRVHSKALKLPPWIPFRQRRFSSQCGYRLALNGSGDTCDAAL